MKVIRPYDPRWKDFFAAEARVLRTCLGETALDIQHIGSTAIAGIAAKPIIDILVETRSLEESDARAQAMEEAGYEARGEHGISGRRYFKKEAGPSGVGFHVHVFARGAEHIARHIRFRDFLLLNPGIAQDYSALKQSLADSAGVLVVDYAERKAEFVRRVARLAQLHFAQDEAGQSGIFPSRG
jgi:GrpB-like predicted nucleotidyltransferase (UPF0157 family)